MYVYVYINVYIYIYIGVNMFFILGVCTYQYIDIHILACLQVGSLDFICFMVFLTLGLKV